MRIVKRFILNTILAVDSLLGIRRWLVDKPASNTVSIHRLQGEKLLDWAWIISNMPPPPAKVIDIGCDQAPLVPVLHDLGYEVLGIDVVEQMPYSLAGAQYVSGDFLSMDLEPDQFDVAILCSVVEHVGLAGRYGCVVDEPDGDLRAMGKVRTVLKPSGCLLLTIPVGIQGVYAPYHRVYGEERLAKLTSGFSMTNQRYFTRDYPRPWRTVDRTAALSTESSAEIYALGEFSLRKNG